CTPHLETWHPSQEVRTGPRFPARSKPEVIKLGLDLHARQATECRQLDGPWKLLNQVEEWVNAGIKVYSCYGPGWYWYAISPVVVGGVSIFGGSGSVYGA